MVIMKTAAPTRVPRDELHQALEQVLSDHFKTPRRVRHLRRRISAYSSSCTIENLEVTLDRGQKLSLVLKDLSPGSRLAAAKKVRPPFLYESRRELEIYRRILRPGEHGTAICYGAIESVERQRYWLFLERVKGPLLWQIGRLNTWEQAARWLAAFHSGFEKASGRGNLAGLPGLLRYDEQLLRTWLVRARKFLHYRNGAASRDLRRRFERLAGGYELVIKRLLQFPTTFIHGEFYPSNIIVNRSRNAARICPIDWELAAVAPGPVDLAALTSGNWTPEQKQKLLAAYRDGLTAGSRPSMAELAEAVEYCQLHLSVQMLGWSPKWSPPLQHAQNWLHEALRLAANLGL